MDVTTYSEARANLKSLMDRVIADRDPIVIARRRGQSVVVVALDDWNAMQTTTRLLSTPENAERLRRSITQMDAGKGVERALIEP